jgi:hypothetical protein
VTAFVVCGLETVVSLEATTRKAVALLNNRSN